MVIISHKLRLWALLILIIVLKGRTAATKCYIGQDLETNTLDTDSFIRDEGFYLLKDGVPCDGRVVSIDLCGLFATANADPFPIRYYFFAALYRPQQANNTFIFERITAQTQLQISTNSVFEYDGGISCTRLSLTGYNWIAAEGDIIGVNFGNYSCETQKRTSTKSYHLCTVHAALQTNSSSDIVYFSEHLNTSHSSISSDELSNITEVKLNLRVIVDPLPPLLSKACEIQNNKTTSDTSTTERVITEPSEQQIFTGSGIYIMTERIECSGFVTSIDYCGFFIESWLQPTGYEFTLLHIRFLSDAYTIIDEETVHVHVMNSETIDGPNTQSTAAFNLTCQSHNISGSWYALEGDQFGAIISAECIGYQKKQNLRCPLQIGVISTGCEDSSIFFDNFELLRTKVPLKSIARETTDQVAVKLNFQVHIGQCPTNQKHLYLHIIYGISAIFFAAIILFVTFSVVLMMRLKHSKPQVYNAIKRRVRQGSDRLRNTLSRRNESTTGTIHGIENRSYSEQNEYSTNYHHIMNTQDHNQPRANVNLWTHHQASRLTGSYEEPIDAIDRYEQCNTEEDLYMDPPCKEMDLKDQLQKLEVLKENIQVKEYLGSGRFGIVYRGLLTVTEVDSEGGVKEVAVKTMENGASEEERVKFLQEAAIMGQFNNPYIIKIYGVLVASQPYMIVCELMNRGDLRRYLHTLKILDAQDAGAEIGVLLLNFSRQVVSAMMYLSGKGFVHRDLAARNILVSMDRICKVSDFGLSRDLQDDDYYVAHGGLIPVRWTAPEALKQRKYSTASDVWSYGVVLFEVWSLASRPYGTLTNEQVLHQVLAGYRLPSPAGCPRAVYDLMISCWHPEAVKRPTFTQLHTSLQKPDSVLLEWTEDEQAKYSENARTIGAMYQDGEMLHTTLQKTYVVLATQK